MRSGIDLSQFLRVFLPTLITNFDHPFAACEQRAKPHVHSVSLVKHLTKPH